VTGAGRVGPRVGSMVLIALYGLPFVWLVATSLKTDTDIFSHSGLIFQPTLAAYQQVVNSQLLRSCLNSAVIASGTMVLTLVLATPAAYALARLRGGLLNVGLGVAILLQITPQPATLIPLYRVLGGWELLGSQLGVIMADSALLLPFAILILRPFFISVPHEIEEAGIVDGAARWRVFWQIVLPITLNGIATAATIVFFIAWGEFLYAITFLPNPDQYPISVLIAGQIGMYGIRWSNMMAIAVVASVPILGVYALTHRLLRDGLALGSVR
jgi:multiple sugar transport system permease protein